MITLVQVEVAHVLQTRVGGHGHPLVLWAALGHGSARFNDHSGSLPSSARNYNVGIVEQTSAPTSPLLAPAPDDCFGPLLRPVCCYMDWVSQVLLRTAGTDRDDVVVRLSKIYAWYLELTGEGLNEKLTRL